MTYFAFLAFYKQMASSYPLLHCPLIYAAHSSYSRIGQMVPVSIQPKLPDAWTCTTLPTNSNSIGTIIFWYSLSTKSQ